MNLKSIFLMTVLTSMFTLTAYSFSKAEVPEIKKDCNTCHKPLKAGEKPLLIAPAARLCIECHPDRKTPKEHVVDIKPSMNTGNLPLSDGMLTCITCHDPHNRSGAAAMLRGSPENLCVVCHRK